MIKNDITNDLQFLEYILMCRPYGMDRVGCHGQLGCIINTYKRVQAKARGRLPMDQRLRWNNAHKLYLDLRSYGYFNPKITTCNVCSLCMSPACMFREYTKYTKYK